MIALTQEKRESEIQKIKETIGKIKGDMDIGWNAEEYLLLPLEIALASLTVEPTYSRYRLSAKGSGPDAEKSPWFPGNGKALRKSHDVEVNNLFTSPPVPEIKLPQIVSRSEIAGNEVAREWFLRGCDWYEKEIKRLHGLGE